MQHRSFIREFILLIFTASLLHGVPPGNDGWQPPAIIRSSLPATPVVRNIHAQPHAMDESEVPDLAGIKTLGVLHNPVRSRSGQQPSAA
ncbi:MAG: hypothetical protein ABL974_23535, partial [Prosthecobacter sp.]